jgi:hypothetical protein
VKAAGTETCTMLHWIISSTVRRESKTARDRRGATPARLGFWRLELSLSKSVRSTSWDSKRLTCEDDSRGEGRL